MQGGQQTRFTFMGTAHPERRSWWFRRFKVVEPSGVTFEAEMQGSRFVATLTVPAKDYDDLLTAKNHAASNIQTVVDAIGLVHGAAISCAIGEAIGPDGALHALDPTIDDLGTAEDADVARLAAAGFNDHAVRLGMADVRMAISIPTDTAFLCYRAIEGVQQTYGSWPKFREELGVTMDEVMELKALADPRRHGGLVSLTEEQRIKALRLAHRVILGHAGIVWERLPPQARGTTS